VPYPFDAVCTLCSLQYKVEKQGVYVIEMASFGPYKIWMADLKECPKCHHRIVTGFGHNALSEHYQEGFTQTLKQAMDSGAYFLFEHKGDS
jgi:hypothetical protein